MRDLRMLTRTTQTGRERRDPLILYIWSSMRMDAGARQWRNVGAFQKLHCQKGARIEVQ